MKVLKGILVFLLKVLMYWFYIIPFNFHIIALAGYMLLFKVLYGGWQGYIVERACEDYGVSYFWGCFVPFAVPFFIAFFRLFTIGNNTNRASTSALDNAIEHRNRMMNHKSDKEAYEIFQKTSSLDVMKNSNAFDNAVRGFNAEYGNSSPSKIFDDFTK